PFTPSIKSEAEKNEDGIVSHVVVRVAPVGVAHVRAAVAAAAVGGVGDASALCEIGRREREAAALGNEALDLRGGQWRTHVRTRARCEETAGLAERRRRREEQCEACQHTSSNNMTQRHWQSLLSLAKTTKSRSRLCHVRLPSIRRTTRCLRPGVSPRRPRAEWVPHIEFTGTFANVRGAGNMEIAGREPRRAELCESA